MFTYDRETEGEYKQRERGEGDADSLQCREPDAGLDPGTRDRDWSRRQMLNRLSHLGASKEEYLKIPGCMLFVACEPGIQTLLCTYWFTDPLELLSGFGFLTHNIRLTSVIRGSWESNEKSKVPNPEKTCQ